MPQLETATYCNLNTLQLEHTATRCNTVSWREERGSAITSRPTTVERSGTISWFSKELTGVSQKHPRKKVGPRQAQEIREVTSLVLEVPPKNGKIALLLATNRECELKYVSQKRYWSIN